MSVAGIAHRVRALEQQRDNTASARDVRILATGGKAPGATAAARRLGAAFALLLVEARHATQGCENPLPGGCLDDFDELDERGLREAEDSLV